MKTEGKVLDFKVANNLMVGGEFLKKGFLIVGGRYGHLIYDPGGLKTFSISNHLEDDRDDEKEKTRIKATIIAKVSFYDGLRNAFSNCSVDVFGPENVEKIKEIMENAQKNNPDLNIEITLSRYTPDWTYLDDDSEEDIKKAKEKIKELWL